MASPLTVASRQARIQFTDDATCDSPFTSGLKRTFGDTMSDMQPSVVTWEALLKKQRVNIDHSITKGDEVQDSAIVLPSNNGAIVSPVPDLNFAPFSSEEWRKQFSRMPLREMLTNIEHRDSWPWVDGLIPSMRRSPVLIRRFSLAFHYYPNGIWPAKILDIIPSIWNRVPFCHFHELLEWSATCMPPGFLHKGIGEGYVRAGSWNSEIKARAYLIIHQDNEAYLRTLALTCPELTDIWDILTLALIYEIPFHIGFLLRDYHAFSYPQASLSLDDRTLVKSFLEPSYTNLPLIYRRSGIALISEYRARIRDVLKRPHLRALIGMGGTAGILGRIYGGEELIRQFMEGPSILVRQHLLGQTDTDAVDGIGLIWDRVTPGELDVLHGCMVGPGEVKHSLYPTQDIVQEGIPTSWSGFVHDAFKKISAEVDAGTAVARSNSEWLQYLGQNYGDLFKKISIVPADISNSGYLPGAIDYKYGHALCKEAFSYSWHQSRLDDLSIPLPLQNAFP